jgi:pyruvate formate-lyase activating enzyme-like uncharacterized protein
LHNDLKKIRLASEIFGVGNIGLEFPMIPEKKGEILDFIKKSKNFISFVNLNEFELSETNFNFVTKNYFLDKNGYIIKESKNAGIWILKIIQEENIFLKVHFCSADLKNNIQFVNRLKNHKVLNMEKRTQEGTVVYLSIYPKKNQKNTRFKKRNSFRGYRL